MSLDKVVKNYEKANIAVGMDEDTLTSIGADVVKEFDIDWNSQTEWREQNEEGLKLAKQVKEEKSFPWRGAANVKYPLITSAALQFAARAYPEIVQKGGIAKAKAIGKVTPEKADRAERVSKHMSWQLSDQMTEWEEETDRLLHVLPVIGCLFRKTYFCPTEGRNISVFCLPDEVVVHRKIRSLEAARRVSHCIYKYDNDIHENVKSGLWLDIEPGEPDKEDDDPDTPHEFIEQHRFLDLDDDGYKEPYIVTVHKKTQNVVRIVARYELENIDSNRNNEIVKIKPTLYFTKYGFIPNPDGSYLDIGFGVLMSPINESVNTVINQLLDSGTLYNTSGGFIGRGIRIKGGKLLFEPNEWKTVEVLGQDLKNQIVPLPVREPSNTLFMLLGTLIEAGKEISSVKDVLTGEKPGENVSVETVLAIVEQGLKVFTGIYQRIYRSLSKELKILFWLNSKYLQPEEYFNVLDEDVARVAYKRDYNTRDCDIYPTADPNMSLDVLRLTRAQALMQMMGQPGINNDEVIAHYLEAIKVDKERFYIPPDKRNPEPAPEVEKLYHEMDMAEKEFKLKQGETLQKMRESVSKIVLNLAKADSQTQGPEIERLRLWTQHIGDLIEREQAELEARSREKERTKRVEEQGTNKESG